jgi:hypothetical protein
MLWVALVLDQAKPATAGQIYRCCHEFLPPGNEILFSALLDPLVPRRLPSLGMPLPIACRGWFTPEHHRFHEPRH